MIATIAHTFDGILVPLRKSSAPRKLATAGGVLSTHGTARRLPMYLAVDATASAPASRECEDH